MARLLSLLVAAVLAFPLLAAQASAGSADSASRQVRAGGDVAAVCVVRSSGRVRLPSQAGSCAQRERTLVLRPSRRRSLCLSADAVRRVGAGRCAELDGVLRRLPSRKAVTLCVGRGRWLHRITKLSRCAAEDRRTIRNHAPADLALHANQLVATAAPGALVGAVSVVEVDRGDHVRFSLVDGDGDSDNARFVLDATLLRARAALPAGSYSIRVQARDLLGRRTVAVFAVTVAGS